LPVTSAVVDEFVVLDVNVLESGWNEHLTSDIIPVDGVESNNYDRFRPC